jgi:hypothetical protein
MWITCPVFVDLESKKLMKNLEWTVRRVPLILAISYKTPPLGAQSEIASITKTFRH